MALKQYQVKEYDITNFHNESVSRDLFILGCIYRPPILNLLYLKNIINCVNHIYQLYPNHRFLITADFSLLNILCNLDTTFSTNILDLTFIQCIMENSRCQLAYKPTRENNALCLIFVKESDDLVKCGIIPKLIASDHDCLQITISYNECDINTISNNHAHNYNLDFAKGRYLL